MSKEHDIREACGKTIPIILNSNKEEILQDKLPFNRQIRPRPFTCAQFPVYNSLNIIPFDVTNPATYSVIKQNHKNILSAILHYIRSWLLIQGK
jgi:hypothetical protein